MKHYGIAHVLHIEYVQMAVWGTRDHNNTTGHTGDFLFPDITSGSCLLEPDLSKHKDQAL